ncbi:hypothetical protein DMA11_21080 [Marinilabiliaceae bacterium JC017]|nr:hypothetical protein DMA11_21080 [Marinilabiliaceae bacterium JC017]
MKNVLILVFGFIIVPFLTAQNKPGKELKPKGMKFIPEGNFVKKTINKGDTLSSSAHVWAF